MVTRGRFITLEGLEGVGKTSNRDVIEATLREADIEFITTREPGGTDLGEQLRQLVLHASGPISAEAELMMMAASRKQLTADVIVPALSSGKWVICDRYADASYAYQGGGRELGLAVVAALHALLRIDLKPDLTFLLDMPIADGLRRMAARDKPDRIEKEEFAFFERARAAYLQRAKEQPERIKVVDASLSLAEVELQVKEILNTFLANDRD